VTSEVSPNRVEFKRPSKVILSQEVPLCFVSHGPSTLLRLRDGDTLTNDAADKTLLPAGDALFHRGAGDPLLVHRVVGRAVRSMSGRCDWRIRWGSATVSPEPCRACPTATYSHLARSNRMGADHTLVDHSSQIGHPREECGPTVGTKTSSAFHSVVDTAADMGHPCSDLRRAG
jgi:hypothetical protein